VNFSQNRFWEFGFFDNMDAESEIIQAGLLRKKGGRVNTWGERYFVLRGHTLFYYVKSTDTVCLYSTQRKINWTDLICLNLSGTQGHFSAPVVLSSF
jgi:hypothetical protein